MNVRKTITTSALALGVLAGSAGIASAMSSPGSTAPPTNTVEAETQDPTLSGSVQSLEVEGLSEAADSTETDGIDHQFEGEETGANGDGVPDADDATEALEVAPAN